MESSGNYSDESHPLNPFCNVKFNNGTKLCNAYNNSYFYLYYVEIIIIMFVILYNFAVYLSMITSRHILRHNMVYIYVANCLVAIVVFALVLLIQSTSVVANVGSWEMMSSTTRYDTTNSNHRGFLQFTVTMNSLLCGLILTTTGSTLLMIQSVGNTALFISKWAKIDLKTIESQVSEESVLYCFNFSKKRLSAGFLISLNWVFPVICAAVNISDNTCLKYCCCLPGYFPMSYREFNCVKDGFTCSKFIIITRRSFTLAVLCVLILLIVIKYAITISTLRKFYKAHEPPKQTETISDETAGNEVRETASSIKKQKPPPMNQALKSALWIVASNTVFFLPLVCVQVYDVFDHNTDMFTPHMVALSTALLYFIALPTILIVHLPGTICVEVCLICADIIYGYSESYELFLGMRKSLVNVVTRLCSTVTVTTYRNIRKSVYSRRRR